MNVLHIIGNGFDLNLGLKTGYKDFYNEYNKTPNEDKLINILKKEIGQNHKNWCDLEFALGDYTYNIDDVDDFRTIYDDIQDELMRYLIKEEQKLEHISFNTGNFFKDLLFPHDYVENTAVNNLNYSIPDNNKTIKVDIITLNYTNSIEAIINQKTIQNLVDYNINLQNNLDITHIHGTCNGRVVLGVNDTNQISNEEFKYNEEITTDLVKQECLKRQNTEDITISKKKIKNADLICIYGCSIGKTDNYLWEQVAKSILENGSKLLIFDYDRQCNGRRIQRINLKKERLKSRFIECLIKPEIKDVEALENSIFCEINSSIFSRLKLSNDIEKKG